ncbi:protein of unknown function DUF72 [Ferroglobus placidus DSM 10642]|uniref:DUF72 domain-containing protein n=1 Tax=Ferroglobus placidus (strain DSM 10642 / AEDII12DO) TaxID=589924 RepID=D3RWK6_FERPA|nr:DUF72 domain-containing protein [Ferroglobus placidus]ADC64869.1 protein of unknown function DUF72 [Ferroglobus placidus DSM 10642]
MRVKVGCCGFCMAMNKYFSEFKLVEVQKTFYQPVSEKTAKSWREKAPEDFEFAVKAFQKITHPPNSPTYKKYKVEAKDCGFFKPNDEVFEAWEVTRKVAKILKAKVILFQTPKSFVESEENVKNMREFFNSIEREFVFVWEPRGWSEEKVKEVCEELDLVHCVDPFVAKPTYGEIVYFRLHGSHERMYKHKYTDEELLWLKNLCESYDKEVYVLFNNVYMCEDAKRFAQLF